MNLYIMQEFLGVLLVVAALMGTVLVFGIAVICFQEVMRRAVHGARTQLTPIRGLSAKDQWLQGNHSRSALRGGNPNSAGPEEFQEHSDFGMPRSLPKNG